MQKQIMENFSDQKKIRTTFHFDDHIYYMDEVDEFLDQELPIITRPGKNQVDFYNVPCSFDIETTSTYDGDGNKIAFMYIWQFGLNGRCIIGRTWNEFVYLMKTISDRLRLCENRILVCYCHNLSFEFQFMRKYLKWIKIFAYKERTPISAQCDLGIIFKCSYILTNLSLDNLSKKLMKYKVSKMVGDLDYSLIRHSGTTIDSEKELIYCINDIKIVMAYIQEQIEKEEKIYKIPLTSTGYCRRHCRNLCLPTDKAHKKEYWKYRNLMKNLTITPPEYELARRAFMGGFTHTCPLYSGNIVNDAGSIDLTSDYPAEMVKQKYPMSKGRFIKINNKKDFDYYRKRFCCIFDIEFIGIQSKVDFENYIPSAHCRKLVHPIINNGRVYSADSLYISITEVDYELIEAMYTWKEMRIGTFVRYIRAYLPTPLIKGILDLYKNKTTLKGTTEGDPFKEELYMYSKSLINAIYGMTCTDIVRDEIIYSGDEWDTKSAVLKEDIQKYNDNYNRFLYYPWGLYVTAYARRDLFTGIFEFANYYHPDKPCHYIYTDTDSIKGCHLDEHMDYIHKYNELTRKQLYQAMDYHNLPRELVEPLDSKDNPHLLGEWDLETMNGYKKFIAFGAKRYCYIQDDELHLTVSGLNKKAAIPYLLKKYKTPENVLKHFKSGLVVPAGATGKLTHTYYDERIEGVITDYQGKEGYYEAESFVHLSEQPYEMSISAKYIDFLHLFMTGILGSNRREKI